jgi:predicted O-methyltransferase YrrM
MDFERVRAKVDGIPHMDAHHGRLIYEHVRNTRPSLILELGTANGVSAAYMCAALEANDHGRLVTIDIDAARYDPGPETVFAGLRLEHRVDFVRVPDSSYDWHLRGQIAERSDQAGNCEPLYDFIFIDGAHEFTIDGLAAVLASRLLKPGGWLLLDDLSWTHASTNNTPPFPMSPDQLATPNVREVFDWIVKPDPSYAVFREQDEGWGWAQKGTGPRMLTLSVTESLVAVATRKAKAMWRRRKLSRDS